MNAHDKRVVHSSGKKDWPSPEEVLALVRMLGPIGLDPCGHARGDLVRAAKRYTQVDDGLVQSWLVDGIIYINPPYGRGKAGAAPWVNRAIAEAALGCEIVMLLPSRTDCAWFQKLVRAADAICFWAGRVKFVGADNGAPFPSLIAYFGPRVLRFREVFSPFGWIP